MRFNTGAPLTTELRIGNVYPAQGRESGTYWIVVGILDKSVAVLRITGRGEICGAQTYGKHVFDGSNLHFRKNDMLLGTCDSLNGLTFDIDWRR